MTELELHKFVERSNSEWHWTTHDKEEEVYLFVHVYDIRDFMLLLGSTFLTNTDTKVTIKDNYLVFEMTEICEYFNIEVENMFSKVE